MHKSKYSPHGISTKIVHTTTREASISRYHMSKLRVPWNPQYITGNIWYRRAFNWSPIMPRALSLSEAPMKNISDESIPDILRCRLRHQFVHSTVPLNELKKQLTNPCPILNPKTSQQTDTFNLLIAILVSWHVSTRGIINKDSWRHLCQKIPPRGNVSIYQDSDG